MTPEVVQAVEEIRGVFSGAEVELSADDAGGAYVIVRGAPLAEIYCQSETWVGFHLTHTYPYADVYPHFVRADLARRDGRPLGDGTSLTTFQGRSAVQLSRRSNRHNPATDTATLKLQKVLRWLNSRP